ncbi:hypothetical protein [Xanthomonas sp. XNM01]|uniref:hypothetical protein n=1 Tax=Xanthomonas sp. XNM01 TaxID=2769289 RepID=UPI00177B6513|nr:hypothetical protein [Xanthomonas sp. XNM01]
MDKPVHQADGSRRKHAATSHPLRLVKKAPSKNIIQNQVDIRETLLNATGWGVQSPPDMAGIAAVHNPRPGLGVPNLTGAGSQALSDRAAVAAAAMMAPDEQ